ncbi:alpha-glucosidase [Histomonas meleagridis]|uniref:alpha-glucosidase n=1 Tax=Histomonas meleagridis TaxID=135588 RepID=UPI003559F2B7|nr:alpha-glucosidase [Histomonas meleagridis]KAH0798292.1 alpha-glucosidase [Histomonas meleagridis]
MQKAWWKEAVVYQIYPRSFMDSNGDGIGDLKGITSKLDYLKNLGIDVVWLSPCYKSPNDDNGYDISDYRDIMTDFGTFADWEEMISEMHKRGIKLVMDLVVNHTSDEHPWFIESRSSRDSPKRDYYIWRPGHDGKPPNNWTSFFSGPAWEYDEHTEEYYLHLFTKKQPDLNWENPTVREEVYSIVKFWLDHGVDGFRMDVISLISKVEGLPDGHDTKSLLVGSENYAHGPRVHEFLNEMNSRVLSKYDIMTVGETAFVTPEEAVKYTDPDRHELNMVFQFELMGIDNENDKWFIKKWKLSDLKAVQTKWQTALNGKCWNSLYLSNHDQPRCVSRFGNDSPEFRKISAKMLATMNHTLQGTPYIYQGEELGMTNVLFDDINDYKDVEIHNFWKEYVLTGKMDKDKVMEAIHYMGRDNARTPMQWDDSNNAGFTTGTPWIKVNPNYKEINAKESLSDKDSIFYYYQKLIQLRHKYDIFVYGDYTAYYPDDENLYVYTRCFEGHILFVALNFRNGTFDLEIPEGVDLTGAVLLISNYPNGDNIPNKLRPYEAVVYYK